MKHLLTNGELSIISRQLAMILHSGISSLEGLAIMRDDLPEGEGREILSTVYEELELTYDLPASFRKANVFPEYFLKMIEIGDRSGTLEDVMENLADYYDRQDTLTKSIREALVYPLVLLGMLFAVLIVLMSQVMPVFQQVFSQLGVQMSGASLSVFHASKVIQYIAIAFLVLVLAITIYVFISLRSEHRQGNLLQMIQHVPVFRDVTSHIAIARFANALSLSLHSGLDMSESFTLASALVTEPGLSDKMTQAGELISQGEDLANVLKTTGIITGLHARMVSIGFHTGSAETVFRQISAASQEEADTRLQNMVNALEPTLTAILAILTGMILVSVMLPLLSVMANIG